MNKKIGALSDGIQKISNRLKTLENDFEKYKKQSQARIEKEGISAIKRVSLTIEKQTDKQLNSYTQYIKSEIKKDINFAREDLEKTAMQVFSKSEFIKKLEDKLIRMIEEQIKVSVKNADLHKLVGDILHQYIRDNLKELVSKIVIDLINSVNRKLTREYKVAKELTYSIDAEIRHTLMEAPISANSEEMIKKKIMMMLEKMPLKDKMIEDKNV